MSLQSLKNLLPRSRGRSQSPEQDGRRPPGLAATDVINQGQSWRLISGAAFFCPRPPGGALLGFVSSGKFS